MESLRPRSPFGIHTTVVNPGFFRTELLTEESTNYATRSIDDYAARREPLVAYWRSMNGKQSGDPAKLGTRDHHHRQSVADASPFHRRCRCNRRSRAQKSLPSRRTSNQTGRSRHHSTSANETRHEGPDSQSA